jgi:hypothetical protein
MLSSSAPKSLVLRSDAITILSQRRMPLRQPIKNKPMLLRRVELPSKEIWIGYAKKAPVSAALTVV